MEGNSTKFTLQRDVPYANAYKVLSLTEIGQFPSSQREEGVGDGGVFKWEAREEVI